MGCIDYRGRVVYAWYVSINFPYTDPTVLTYIMISGILLLFQSAIIYLPLSYPQYAASILAGNALVRSTAAAAFPYASLPFCSYVDSQCDDLIL